MSMIQKYLSGEAFCDDLRFAPNIIGEVGARNDVLVSWAAKRRVLHVGFADHVPLISYRAAEGTWLHASLSKEASSCLGVDINQEAIAIARKLGFENTLQLDIFAPEAERVLAQYDAELVLVPDVIEHLPDPAAFLRRLVQCMPMAEFVVSVPNALSLRNAMNGIVGLERINTDHRVWFSPFTLLKVLSDAGLSGGELHGCQIVAPGSWRGRLLRRLTIRNPLWSDVLIARIKRPLG